MDHSPSAEEKDEALQDVIDEMASRSDDPVVEDTDLCPLLPPPPPPSPSSPPPHSRSSSRSGRRRRGARRLRYAVLALTTFFIFFSIALTVLYFSLPRLIKQRMEQEQRLGRRRVSLEADPVRLHILTDRSFRVDMQLRVLLDRPAAWGMRVWMPSGAVVWKNVTVCTFGLAQSVHVGRAVDHVDTLRSVRVSISDPVRFGDLVNTLLVHDSATVDVVVDVRVRPDYFVAVPPTRVRMEVPIDGLPMLLRSIDAGASRPAGVPFDVREGRAEGLLVHAKVPFLPFAQLGVSVLDAASSDLLASVRTTPSLDNRTIVEARLPRLNDGMRRILSGTSHRVRIVGDVDACDTAFRDVARQIDAVVSLPDLSAQFGLVKQIVLVGWQGKTATVCCNPFSVDVVVDRIETMDIYRTDMEHKRRHIGSISNAAVHKTIPAGSDDRAIEMAPSGRMRFTGGLGGAVQLIKDVHRRGHVLVDMDGAVTVRLGRYVAERLPVRERSIKVQVKWE